MKVEILGILERGIANRERLHLRVLTEINLNYFIVFRIRYTSPTSIGKSPSHVYWFPSTPVRPGDQVILYTGIGTATHTKNADGTTTHIFYWGNANTIWNATGEAATVFEITTWQTTPYE